MREKEAVPEATVRGRERTGTSEAISNLEWEGGRRNG